MKLRLASVLVFTLTVLAVAPGAQAERLEGGTFEWSIAGDFSRSSFDVDGQETGDLSDFWLSTELGYFITPVFELAVSVGGSRLLYEPQDPQLDLPNEEANSIGFGARLLANIPNGSEMTPYAYLGVARASFSGDEDLVGDEAATVLPSGGVGVRYFMGDHVSFNLEFDFTHVNNRNGFKDANADILSFRLGFSAFLNRE